MIKRKKEKDMYFYDTNSARQFFSLSSSYQFN